MLALLVVMSAFTQTELEQIGRKMACNEYFGASLGLLYVGKRNHEHNGYDAGQGNACNHAGQRTLTG